MRHALTALGLAGLLAAAGCTNGRLNVLNSTKGPDQVQVGQEVPTAAKLVHYMDDNAQRVTSLFCDEVEQTISVPGQVPFTLHGKMACQRGRRFRMVGEVLGKREVDLGSNQQEFWYWIKRAETPYQFYCSYQALTEGRVKHLPPFPFQPDWVLETLGMGNYGPPERYQPVVAEGDRIKLIERVVGPQGNAVKKVIVFNRRPGRATQPVITDYLLLDDATGKEICSAHIQEIQGDAANGWVPRRLELRWPDQKLKLAIRLNRTKLNTPLNEVMFARPRDGGVTAFDLATGRPDAQGTALRHAGGKQ